MEKKMTRSMKTQKNSIQSKYPLLLSSALVKPMMTIATMAALTMASTASAAVGVDAHADWDDMSIVAGSATVTDTGVGSTLITQSSATAVGEAQVLHIGTLGSVQINQNSTSDLFVARAIGNHSDSSQILGALSATGQVMLLDRNGIIFGRDAQIDVGGIMASTGEVSNTDIMDGDGRFEFSYFGDGSIINNATLKVADAGIAAFVSPFITNNGTINARVGKVAFAAGEIVTLDLNGDGLVEIKVEDQIAAALLENTGTIRAGVVQIEANAARGVVDSVINMEGITIAQTITQDGGKIILGGGSAGKVRVAGTLKASANKPGNGGSVEITGQDIEITETGRVWANGDDAGQGGSIDIVADRRLDVAGRLRAKGIDGTVETSGATLNIMDTTDVSASLWTLDPLSILIADTAYLGNYSYINAGVLSAALTGGTSVLVQTGTTPTGSGHDQGDIRIGSMISNNGGSASISFEALRDLIIETGAGIGGTGTTEVNVDAGRNITLNGSIETNGADMTLKGDGHTRVYDVLSAASGDIYFDGSHVKLFDGSVVTADEIDFTANSVAQEASSAMTARVLTGSVQRKASLFSNLNSFDEIGDFSTGLDAVAAGGMEIYDNAGSLLITGLVSSDRGAVRFGHDGAIWSEELKLTNTGKIQTSNGAVDLDSTSRVIVHGDIDAGNGAVTVGATAVQFWNGSEVLARSIDFDASSVHQYVGAKLDVQRLSGTTRATANFSSVLNEIDILDGFVTGTGGWSDGGLDLYTKNFLQINGPVSTDGGAINITSESRIDVKDGAYVTSLAGDIFLGAATVNLWEDLNTTGTVSGTATLVNVKDDAAEIQDAVDLSATTSLINVAKGDYNEDVLVDGKNIDLRGARKGADARARTGDESTVYGSVTFKNASDGSVNGFTITGGSKGVRLENVNNFLIANNIITNVKDTSGYDDDGIFVDNAQDVLIQRNVVDNSGDDGIHVRNNVDGLVIAQNEIGKAVGDSIDLHLTSGTIRVDRNDISGGSAIGVNAKSTENAIITNNAITGTRNEGIKVTDGSTSARVQGNAVTGGTNGIAINGGSAHIVSSNDVSNSRRAGIDVNNSDSTRLAGNTITDAATSGIAITDSDDVIVNGGNTVNGGQTGLRVENSDRILVAANSFTGQIGAGSNGIGDAINLSDSDTARILNNIITAAGDDGIDFENGSDNAIISGNTVNSAGDNAITVRGNSDNVRILTNDLYNANNGIRVYGGADNAIILTNVIDGMSGKGIEVAANATRINDNTVRNTGNDGIEVSNSANVDVLGNNVSRSGAEGIDVNNSANADVKNNTVLGTASNGISINPSPSSVITGNDVTGAGANGIDVSGSDGTLVKDNFVTGSTQNGIAVSASSNVNVEENFVLFSGRNGIAISGGTDNEVRGNIVALAGGNGIFAENTSGLIVEDNISGLAFGDAIRVESGLNSTITGNLVGLSYGDGIALDDASGTTNVQDNKVLLVGGNGISSINGANTINIDSNEIALVGENGIYIEGGRYVNITNNDVTYAGLGIYEWIDTLSAEGLGALTDDDFSLRTPKLIASGIALPWGAGDGIHVTGAGDVLVDSNQVHLTGGDGIEVGFSGTTNVSNNTVFATGINWTHYSFADIADHFSGLDLYDDILIAGGDALLGDANLAEYVFNILPAPTLSIMDKKGGHGIYVHNGENTATISTNEVRRTANDGIKVSGVFGSQISDNLVNRAGDDGIDVNGGGFADILSNKVRNSDANGIEVSEVSNVLVDGNTVKNAGDNGIKVEDAQYVWISDNTVRFSGDDGIDVDSINTPPSRARRRGVDWNVVIVDNIVSGSDDDGIDVNNSRNVRIARNDVQNSKSSGIELSRLGNARLANNTILASGLEGIDGDNIDRINIVGNNIDDANSDGIELDHVGRVRVYDNTISDVRFDGIDVDESRRVYIAENSIDNARDNGIEVSDTNYLVIENNRIVQSDDDGVNLSDIGYARVANNRIRFSGQDGIDADDVNELYITNNRIGRSDGNGVEVTDSGFVRVNRNTINNSGENGVSVKYTETVRVNRNDISNADDNGIYIDGTGNVRVKYNTVYNSGLNGIFVSDVDRYANIKWNDIDVSGNDGIAVEGVDTTRIVDNRVRNSAGDGIDVEGAYRVEISGNTVRRSKDNGIEVDYSYDVDISGNTVARSKDNGIDVNGVNMVSITGNDITRSGENGIQASDIYGGFYDFRSGSSDYAVFIAGNTVNTTGDDGIEVVYAGRTRIEGNTINDIGVTKDEGDFFGADAIHVRNVNALDRYSPKLKGPEPVAFGNAVEIVGNTIDTTGDDGIQVLFSGDTVVADNTISNIGTDSGARMFGADAVSIITEGLFGSHAYDFGQRYNVEVTGNTINNVSGDGVEVYGANEVLVDGNTISNIGDDGVRITGFNGYFDTESDFPIFDEPRLDGPRLDEPEFGESSIRLIKPIFFGDAPEFNAVVSNNVITTVGGDGVETTNQNRAEISGNDITGAAFNGYYASGPFNGDVVVSDNLFLNNDIGAHFESGDIDLTGEGNGFVNGRIGMRFAPYDFAELALTDEDSFGAWSFASRRFPETGYADMSLVDNTIGSQLFNGQSSYFVELDNEAFFAPGSPTILNALNSTYFIPGSGFITPSSTGGIITADQFNFLESKFLHFTDDASLGLFFFGLVPGVDQEDIFRNIDGFDPEAFNVRLTILGLPRVALPTAGSAAGFDPAFLNQITPAAGGDDTAAGLNAIETAAGSAEETGCQGMAFSSAEAGTAMTYSFGSSMDESSMDSAVDCL
jgi:filamentous hemagglutinin family protein